MSSYPKSYYAHTIEETRAFPPLEGEIAVETVVVGGGLAGCATALDLAERGHKVALVEGERIGWGASGRNGGFVATGYPSGIPALVERVGLAEAQELYKLSRMGHKLLRERIERYAIRCGPVQDGALRCAMADERETLEAFCGYMAENFDTHYEYWPRERVRETLATTQYGDAFLNPYTYAVHPLNLTRGLARAAAERDALIFEETPVTALAGDLSRRAVHTPKGLIRAERIVIACGGYVDGLQAKVSRATIPIATFVAATEPLGNRLRDAIAVPYAISDIKFATNYYRPLADTRLLWGGRVLAWEPRPERIAKLLQRDIARFYPALAEARIDFAWGGLMPFIRHKTPVVGEIEPGLWYATGFGGLGLALTTTAGRLIGAAIAEGDDSWRRLQRFGLPFAGGKLGRVPAQLVYWRHQLAGLFGGGRNH